MVKAGGNKKYRKWKQNVAKLDKYGRKHDKRRKKVDNGSRKSFKTKAYKMRKSNLREKLKSIPRKKHREPKKVRLNKVSNIFNLTKLKSLNKPLIDEDKLATLKVWKTNDVSPKASEIEMKMEVDDDNVTADMRISNLPSDLVPGTQVQLPQQIKGRHWKTVQNMHSSKLQPNNPKCVPSFAHSMFYKRERDSMKEIENQLRDEIRADKHMERMKRKQRNEMRAQNILRGNVVKPIRNMHKLKKFSKKQWKSVLKASVEIQQARHAVRSTFVSRDIHPIV